MKVYKLERPEFLRNWLSEEREVFQPVMDATGNGSWQPIAHGAVEEFDDELRPLMSPKDFFFSEREDLFRFEAGAENPTFKPIIPRIEKRVLFGVKACDLKAIAYQDKHFATDPNYQARRRQTLLVGIDCHAPCEGGFCPTVDAGPTVRDGTADLVLIPMPSVAGEQAGWWLGCNSQAGEHAIWGMNLKLAEEGWDYWRKLTEKRAKASFPNDTQLLNGIRRLNARAIPDELWDKLGIQCLSCSGCTMVCPSCSCYAVEDIKTPTGYVRERFWDSCLMEGFQKEASGANPTQASGKRVQRFWFHKFSDDIASRMDDSYGCVGCGRCEVTCPGSIGVHSVMEAIANA